MQACAIHPDDMELAWPVLEPHVARVCEWAGEWLPSTALRRCLDHSAQLWAIFDEGRPVGAAVTEVIDKDLRRDCNIWLCAGSYSDEARDALLGEIEKWARSIECGRVQLVGRPGWEKKLPDYRRTQVILEKTL